MLELYFFRNVSSYKELWEKTQNAYERKSSNKRRVRIVKTIVVEEKILNQYSDKIKSDNAFIIENRELMMIKNGIWNCIELQAKNKALVIMADGYPYAKYVALKNAEIDWNS